MLAGVKRVENRHFRMKPGWYALHTGAKTSSHESQDPLLNAAEGMPREADLLALGIVGVIEISHSLGLDECVAKEPWAFGPVVNVIRSVCRLPQPVAHRGALSVWRIDADVREQVLAQLPEAQVFQNDISHLPLHEGYADATPSYGRQVLISAEHDRFFLSEVVKCLLV